MGVPGSESATGTKRPLGLWSFVAAVLAVVGFVMIVLSTFTRPGSSLEPPDWLRMIAIPLFPLGATAATILGVLALRRDPDRRWSTAALVLIALVVVAFVVLLSTYDY